jgi:hypothetical protein
VECELSLRVSIVVSLVKIIRLYKLESVAVCLICLAIWRKMRVIPLTLSICDGNVAVMDDSNPTIRILLCNSIEVNVKALILLVLTGALIIAHINKTVALLNLVRRDRGDVLDTRGESEVTVGAGHSVLL